MKKIRIMPATIIVCLIALVAIGSSDVGAQDKQGDRPRGRPERGRPPFGEGGPDSPFFPDPGFRFVSSEMRPGGKVVKGAPYSAEAINESTQTLGDGTKLTCKTSALVYRDSEGRTRREQSSSPVGPFATSDNARRVIFIHDPVAGASYTLFPENRTAQKVTVPSRTSGNRPPQAPRSERPPSDSDEIKTESLGRQPIEGVEVEGTRTTITIPEGKIGNDRPIKIVHERWYSPDLQTTVLSKHSDPRWGETVYKLTKISRAEPDRSLFDLPADYTVKENPRRGREPRREQ